MKTITSLLLLSLAGLVLGSPISTNDDKLIITKSIYVNELVKYKGKHEIVNLIVPLNSINFDEDLSESNSDEDDTDILVFFAEADTDSDGKRVDQGLYVLKEGKATKLLDHGRDAAASSDNSTSVFLAAADGIYVYNKEKNTAEKYGTVDDSIIGIVKEKTGDVIYILTENREVFKVTDNGSKKEKVEDVVNAKQIVLDYSDNLYFYSDDKKPYVRTAEGVKKIDGLPEEPSSVYLVKPPVLLEEGAVFLVDNSVYFIYANGSSEYSEIDFKPKARPSAFAPEVGLIQYYAYDKKIYEYNVLALLMSSLVDDLDKFLQEKADEIRTLSTKSKSHRATAIAAR